MGLDIATVKEEHIDSFRAGSYSGFHEWRNQLAAMVEIQLGEMEGFTEGKGLGKEWTDEMPFLELLNHSDCDGELNSVECEALLADFEKYAAKAKEYSETTLVGSDGEWFLEKYEQWHSAIEQVANDDSMKLIFC